MASGVKKRPEKPGRFRIPSQFEFNYGEMVVDNFAGGGGASMGIEAGLGRPVDIAINHDPGAVEMQLVNHPLTRHLCESLHTITTKDRFGIVTVHGEEYQIADIGMRMLSPRELFTAQGFPDDYIIDRTADGPKITATEQVKRCGNSVPPAFAEALVRANFRGEQALCASVQ
jgi:site-specific DNA-cytosine methylase